MMKERLKQRSGKRGLKVSPWWIAPSKISHNDGIIKSISPNNRQNRNVECFFDVQKNLKIAKSFGPCQPARTAQADKGQYFSKMH